MTLWMWTALALAGDSIWTAPSCAPAATEVDGSWSGREWFDSIERGAFPETLVPAKYLDDETIAPRGRWIADGRSVGWRKAEHALARNPASEKRYRNWVAAAQAVPSAKATYDRVATNATVGGAALPSDAAVMAESGIDPDSAWGKLFRVERYLAAEDAYLQAQASEALAFHLAVCAYNGGPPEVEAPTPEPPPATDAASLLVPPPESSP